ncbi:ribosome silencing factor [Hirschia baltica]|uniref:Ribosomal silencing factor RsfS n=1 Tax=Hirschia baltica (strain ATCC 49814 / DSM 5838 / IFAM 1418) TaxID=582402 RepID=C6XL35_HIRBI|nr:ribosome silencing factor [Hirschia baltica]ACT57864.1 iojap-like protein [Hirschia baltica ATCC 49814]
MASSAQTNSIPQMILDRLDDDKAENIVEIDLMGKSSIADTMIIASGRSTRHVGALADHLTRAFKEADVHGVRVEGLQNCDWVLLDAGDTIVHLFRPEVREFYNLERIWGAETPSSDHLSA